MKISAVSIRSYVLLIGSILLIDGVIASPIPTRDEKEIVLMPMQVPGTRFVQMPVPINPGPSYYYGPYPYIQQGQPNSQTRGPFDFIGQWIQQVPGLPLQVNVPDIFQNIGNGISQAQNSVSQFSQAVGNGVTQFGQNIGNGFNQISSNVGNGFNQFTQNVGNGFQNWMQNLGQRVPIFSGFINTGGNNVPVFTTDNKQRPVIMMVPMEYPAGQQLVLANEAIEAFP